MSEKKFYSPWGAGGYLWRTALFLGGVVLLVFLFSLIKDSDDNPNNHGNPDNRRSEIDTSKIPDPYRGHRDVNPVEDWRDSIPDVAELPDPDDNYIPPVDSSRIVPDPHDSLVNIVCDQIIVFFNSQNLKADIESFAKQFKAAYPDDGYEIKYYNAKAGSMIATVPQDKMSAVLNEIHTKITGIDFYAAPNEILGEAVVPSDDGFKDSHNDEYFRLIQAYEAWDITQGSDSVIVAIVDSYFDLTNPEIKDGYIDPINIPSQTKDVFPPAAAPNKRNIGEYCHGTHVAGCAIGRSDNGKGCSGIAPKCKWIPISVCDRNSGNAMTTFACLEGILYAVYRGADVVNCSFGTSFPEGIDQVPISEQVDYSLNAKKRGEDLWEFIYKTANDHNSVIVKATGNSNVLQGLDAGNRSKNVITVEAVDSKGEKGYGYNQAGLKEYFSNWSKVPEATLEYSSVAAPGVKIWSSTDKRCVPIWQSIGYKASPDGFQEMDGTSMASPIVAGAVALLKSKNKKLTTEQIKKILLMTAKQTDRDPNHRIGPTIQIKDALEATSTGETANFDELMRDHNKLIGKWKSTHEISLYSVDTGDKTDESWIYFIFTSTTSGVVEYHTIMSQDVYRANLKVKWSSDKIEIIQPTDALNSRRENIVKANCSCTPDANRLMNVVAKSARGGGYQCKFEKVN
ncbi:MAG: S8 family serine peptidase [Bacteroidales bacterium]|nr:S8 family serine peptidase [Bacteroidales bacterium]